MSRGTRRDPNDPTMVKEEIERTRERMSGTLDQIEQVLLRKKEKFEEKKADLQRRLDVGARIREEPLATAGFVAGAGFLIGFLTGGDGRGRKAVKSARKRGTKWEKRARRLLQIARDQEQQIERLQVTPRQPVAPWMSDPDAALRYPDDLLDDDVFEGDEYEDLELDEGYDLLEEEDVVDPERSPLYRYGLSGDEAYPLDPDFDDDTIEYRPTTRRGASFGSRLADLVADTFESIVNAMPTRR